jgi:cytochrome c-type biogenesis protein CcmF
LVCHFNCHFKWSSTVFAFQTSDLKKFAASQIIPLTLTAVLTVAIAWAMGMKYWPYMVMLFASTYAFIANATYFGQKIKSGKMRVAGASVAHIGFALILFGTLISQGYQDVISINTMGIEYGKDFDAKTNAENILLYKNQPVQMGQYWVTYKGEEIKNEIDSYFPVLYEKKQAIDDAPTESFTLRPHAQKNPKMGLVANPSHCPARRYCRRSPFDCYGLAQPIANRRSCAGLLYPEQPREFY